MDDDLFGRMKSHQPSGKGAAKGPGKEGPSNHKPAGTLTANEKGRWKIALVSFLCCFSQWFIAVKRYIDQGNSHIYIKKTKNKQKKTFPWRLAYNFRSNLIHG